MKMIRDIIEIMKDDLDDEVAREVNCPECDGTGSFEDAVVCNYCEGKGRIETAQYCEMMANGEFEED